MTEDSYHRQLSVKLKGRDSRGLMILVMDKIKHILSEYKGVDYDISIPCTCPECVNNSRDIKRQDYITKYKYNSLIRRYNEKGKTTVHCDESGQDMSMEELLYNIGLPSPQNNQDAMNKGTVKDISIFLASSKELAVERNEFEIFINRENKRLRSQGIFLNLEKWEDFIDAMSKTRLQDEYNRTIEHADIFISLFHTKVGKYTEEEFDTAYKQLQENRNIYIYTYIKNSDIIVSINDLEHTDTHSLADFRRKLNDLGHFPAEFTDIGDLKFQFKSQLDKILPKL